MSWFWSLSLSSVDLRNFFTFTTFGGSPVPFEGIECAVLGGGPRPQNVLVYNFPYEIPQAVVREALSSFSSLDSCSGDL